jgi:hypothetical protein
VIFVLERPENRCAGGVDVNIILFLLPPPFRCFRASQQTTFQHQPLWPALCNAVESWRANFDSACQRTSITKFDKATKIFVGLDKKMAGKN